VVEDLRCLACYISYEDEWVANGCLLLCPGEMDFRDWMDVQCGVMLLDEYERVGSLKKQCLYSKWVICDDGIVHLIEDLVPGSGKFLYHHYDWGFSGGGVVRWLYGV
jgi:hypothetical protein